MLFLFFILNITFSFIHSSQIICQNSVIQNVFRAFSDKYNLLIVNSNTELIKASELFCVKEIPVIILRGDQLKSKNGSHNNVFFDNSLSLVTLGNENFFYKIADFLGDCFPTIKMLVIFNDFDKINIEKLFKESHEKFKLSRLYIADFSQFNYNAETIEILTYDVLSVDGPKIKTFQINEKFPNDFMEFDEKRYRNWNKNEIRVLLDSVGYVAKVDKIANDSSSLGYVEGEILNIFAEKLNFTIKIVQDTNKIPGFGDKLNNGSFTGYLKMFENNEIDMAANAKLVMNYGTKYLVFLYPNRLTTFNFIVPKKNWNDINVIKEFFAMLEWKVYALIYATIFIGSILLFGIHKVQKDEFSSFVKSSLTILSISLSVSTRLSQKWAQRWLLGSFMLTFLIASNLFAGAMTDFFYNLNHFDHNIRTIDELLESNLQIKVKESLIVFFNNIDESSATKNDMIIHKSLKSTFEAIKSGDESAFVMKNIDKIIREKKSAVLLPPMIVFELLVQYEDEITYIKESPYSMFVASSIRRHLPMQKEFNFLIMLIGQSGITEYQINLARNDRDLKFIRKTRDGKNIDESPKPFTLWQTSIVFVLHGIILFLAFLVFLAELFVHWYQKKNGRKRSKMLLMIKKKY